MQSTGPGEQARPAPAAGTGPPAPQATRSAADPPSGFPDVPGRPVLVVLAVLVILGGHLGAQYLDDPASIPGPWQAVAGWVAGIIVFLAASTLTQILAVFMTPVRLPSTRRFLDLVGTYSVIGAILGIALSFRGAMHLFVDADRDAARYGLPDFLGTVSDDVTITTLVMVALCWPYTVKLFVELAAAMRERHAQRGLRIPGTALFSFAILAAGNLIGLNTAFFAYELMTRYP